MFTTKKKKESPMAVTYRVRCLLPTGKFHVLHLPAAPTIGDFVQVDGKFYEVKHRMLWESAQGIQISLIDTPFRIRPELIVNKGAESETA